VTAAVPEPSTWAMMIPWLRRHRPEAKASVDGRLIQDHLV
jgi:hypothetical protein